MTKVWSAWSGKGLEGVLQECRELLEDMSFPTVHRWREGGGKVVGHFQVYFPEELAHAVGMLPVKLRGFPIERKAADSHFGSYICSIVRSNLEVALTKRLPLDLFVSHPICDVARNLPSVWRPNFQFPCLLLRLPQNPTARLALDFLEHEYRSLLSQMEEITGKEVTDDDLRGSIEVFNENRHLLRELYRIKREHPWLLSVEEAYVLMAVGTLLPRREHNELLRYAIPLIYERKARPQDKLRVVLLGGFCEQLPLELLRIIGESCYVVDDDLLIGLRWITYDVPTQGDPVRNLAQAYLESDSFSPVQHDPRRPKEEMILRFVRQSGAEAAIIGAAKMCEPGLDEQVAYAKALDEAGIRYFVFDFEEAMTSFEQIQLQIETFVESIMFV
ncbi:MAG: 2-hydroxyacyl-CoA dehydratase family protein [Dehalococcoidia bacterium]|nr:2-hydroxyacyl-CoA dehydratase family protein [Dehalococcoidia bacterium]